MPLPSDRYRDPALWLEMKQEREERERERARRYGCEGCQHKTTLWGVDYCALGLTVAGKANMRRCGRYKNKGE